MKLRTVKEINSKFEEDYTEVESMLTLINDLREKDVITSRERHLLAVSIQNRQQMLCQNRHDDLVEAILYFDSSQNVQSLRQTMTERLEKMLEAVQA